MLQLVTGCSTSPAAVSILSTLFPCLMWNHSSVLEWSPVGHIDHLLSPETTHVTLIIML